MSDTLEYYDMLTSSPEIQKAVEAFGVELSDFQAIVSLLGREPSVTELAMFSVEWSEHCSYRRSKKYLRQFPRKGRYPVLVGDDAGGVIVDDLAIVFKVESHNHPSQVEPKHGAATGVGGIIRDILSCGARPVAVLDSLRFGLPDADAPAVRRQIAGIVDGIQWYGNCIGVPTVGGETKFHEGYRGNCLVNVMCAGIVEKGRVLSSRAVPGCAVLYLGSRTGRDGIGGCSVLASQELEDSNRSTVQVGDPFFGKCLIEATLEAHEKGLFVAIKDMGAAGLTCTISEMSAAGGCGMKIDLDKVPAREVADPGDPGDPGDLEDPAVGGAAAGGAEDLFEPLQDLRPEARRAEWPERQRRAERRPDAGRRAGMAPYELLMSESQERMLAVVGQEDVGKVQEIFKRWGLEAEVIGETVQEDRVIIKFHGEVVADLAAGMLVSPPLIECAAKEPPRPESLPIRCHSALSAEEVATTLLQLLSSPNASRKGWIFHQYDHTVQTNTIEGPGGDAAVLRIKGSRRGLALTMDGAPVLRWQAGRPSATLTREKGVTAPLLENGRPDPFLEAQLIVAEAARNLVCVGAVPAAVTDCLNFGNPEKPDRYWAFRESVRGLTEACEQLSLPVVSGNVSFYNESPEGAIPPTPIVGMLGIVDDVTRVCQAGFQHDGDLIVLLGWPPSLESEGRSLDGPGGDSVLSFVPFLWKREIAVQEACLQAIQQGILSSAHDCSEGGVGVTVAESCLIGSRGARIDWPPEKDLFAEIPSQIVVSLSEENLPRLEKLAAESGAPLRLLGKVGGDNLTVTVTVKGQGRWEAKISLSELQDAWGSFGKLMEGHDGSGR